MMSRTAFQSESPCEKAKVIQLSIMFGLPIHSTNSKPQTIVLISLRNILMSDNGLRSSSHFAEKKLLIVLLVFIDNQLLQQTDDSMISTLSFISL